MAATRTRLIYDVIKQSLSPDDSPTAAKFALIGMRMALKILGVEREGLLAKFVEQEFQAELARAREAIQGAQFYRPPKRPVQAARPSRATGQQKKNAR